jgi:two-component system response regulator NreC
MNRTTIVLADDHALLRTGLRALIDEQADMVVVGEASNGLEVVDRVQEHLPRVLCLDYSMPGWGIAATIARVREVSPRTQIMVLTMHDDPAYARAAFAHGANGYFLKTSPLAETVAAIRDVAKGETVIDGSLREALQDAPDAKSQNELSRREIEVLQLLAKGLTHQEIADRLFLSVKTIETYRARLRAKTGLKSRADFVQYGLEAGLLLPGDGGGKPAEQSP